MSKRAVMITAILFGIGITAVHAELIIAGWDSTNTWTGGIWDANIKAADITAVGMRIIGVSVRDFGSNDGTFGSFPGAETGVGTGAILFNGNAEFEFTVTNTGTQPYELTAFRFDAWRSFNGGSPGFEVSIVSGNITTGLLANVALTIQGSNLDTDKDMQDVDILLTGLADHTLAAGESVTFRIVATAGGGAILDNIAVTGVVPETRTIQLLIIS